MTLMEVIGSFYATKQGELQDALLGAVARLERMNIRPQTVHLGAHQLLVGRDIVHKSHQISYEVVEVEETVGWWLYSAGSEVRSNFRGLYLMSDASLAIKVKGSTVCVAYDLDSIMKTVSTPDFDELIRALDEMGIDEWLMPLAGLS